MARRGIITTLLIIVIAQIAGGMLFASVCNEPCPDDNDQRSCPPMCSFCTTCAHAQQAIVQPPMGGMMTALPATASVFISNRNCATSQRADDIFHVPLLG